MDQEIHRRSPSAKYRSISGPTHVTCESVESVDRLRRPPVWLSVLVAHCQKKYAWICRRSCIFADIRSTSCNLCSNHSHLPRYQMFMTFSFMQVCSAMHPIRAVNPMIWLHAMRLNMFNSLPMLAAYQCHWHRTNRWTSTDFWIVRPWMRTIPAPDDGWTLISWVSRTIALYHSDKPASFQSLDYTSSSGYVCREWTLFSAGAGLRAWPRARSRWNFPSKLACCVDTWHTTHVSHRRSRQKSSSGRWYTFWACACARVHTQR